MKLSATSLGAWIQEVEVGCLVPLECNEGAYPGLLPLIHTHRTYFVFIPSTRTYPYAFVFNEVADLAQHRI